MSYLRVNWCRLHDDTVMDRERLIYYALAVFVLFSFLLSSYCFAAEGKEATIASRHKRDAFDEQ